MGLIAHTVDETSAFGSVASAMDCTARFPVIASLGAAIGLGFLQEYEGLLIFTLLPLFVVVALLANAPGRLNHRQWHRSLFGMTGSAIVFTGTVWLFGN